MHARCIIYLHGKHGYLLSLKSLKVRTVIGSSILGIVYFIFHPFSQNVDVNDQLLTVRPSLQ